MELTQVRTLKTIAVLLLLLAVSQSIYTALFIGAPDVDRRFIWRFEGIVFVLLAVLCVLVAIKSKRHTLSFCAISLGAVLKLLAVGIGLTLFNPFNAAGEMNADLAEVATSIIAFSFFCYNSGNILAGLAAMEIGKSKSEAGSRLMGRTAFVVGALAFASNAAVMMFGFQGFLPSPVAGALGVVTTVLLAICLFSVSQEEETQ